MSGRVILCVVVAASVVAVAGCKDDGQKEAIAALQVLADAQTKQVETQNDEIIDAVEQFEACVSDVAKVEGDEIILDSKGKRFQAPVLAGEPTVEALEKLRTAIGETIELQKIELAKIQKATATCKEQLATATAAKKEADALEK